MMQHYLSVKAEHPDALLFYQMGDFFELFYEDARRAAALLNISLTSRGRGEEAIPMAGVPLQSIENHLAKLLKHNVAAVLCEQVGSNAKGQIQRAVTRHITAGTVTEEALLEPGRDSILLCIHGEEEHYFIAYLDLSANRFLLSEALTLEQLRAELERLQPVEILLHEDLNLQLEPLPRRRPSWHFERESCLRLLQEHYRVLHLQGFGLPDWHPSLAAAGALLHYLQDMQQLPQHLAPPRLESVAQHLQLDAASRRNLELEYGLNGDPRKALLPHVNRCQTAAGQRLLRRWLNQPLCELAPIRARHDAVASCLQSFSTPALREALRGCADLERISTRIGLQTVRPRELAQLRETLPRLPEIAAAITGQAALAHFLPDLQGFEALHALLESALVEAPPPQLRDGNVFRPEYDGELRQLKRFGEDLPGLLRELEQRERERSGLEAFKVQCTSQQGFFIEWPRSQTAPVPAHWQRYQTLKSVERYRTPEIEALDEQRQQAEHLALQREKELYADLLQRLQSQSKALYGCAQALAQLDVFSGWAQLAQEQNYCRPEMLAESRLLIQGGRHPVVEQHRQPFIANDVQLSASRRLVLITGANMGGKSTYMRQTALLVILAQAGCFVPARAAKMGLFKRIFTRIGASDDLAGARSTFMVEMTETAAILHQADAQSLVIMDEIGRGTSTFDGLALAWATAQRLLEVNRSLTLFATHYFELTALGEGRGAANVHLAALEHAEGIAFLHRVEEGAASQSYGIQVARLAGVPLPVIHQALFKLRELEQRQPKPQQSALFMEEEPPTAALPPALATVLEALQGLDVDGLSPREAWALLAQWQQAIQKSAS